MGFDSLEKMTLLADNNDLINRGAFRSYKGGAMGGLGWNTQMHCSLNVLNMFYKIFVLHSWDGEKRFVL